MLAQPSHDELRPLLVQRCRPCLRGDRLEAATVRHLWADRSDRPLDDLFAIQGDISLSAVGAIEPSLCQAEIERVRRKRPGSPDAYAPGPSSMSARARRFDSYLRYKRCAASRCHACPWTDTGLHWRLNCRTVFWGEL